MKQWDIVQTELPFTDFRGSKARPALVISVDDVNDPDCIIAVITSKEHSNIGDLRIEEDHPEFDKSGLARASTIRFSKIVTSHSAFITDTLGVAGPKIQEQSKRLLRQVFGL